MSPREELELFLTAEAVLPKPAVAAVIAETATTLTAARAALASARQDLAWNVQPTDTTGVVERMIAFTENLREFLAEVPGFAVPRSEFKEHTVIQQANETLAVLHRHLEFVKVYVAASEVRLTRTMKEVDADIEMLSVRGAGAKKTLMDLLEEANKSLPELS